jgi:hypothetical protein
MTVAIKALMFQDAGSAKRIKQRAITEVRLRFGKNKSDSCIKQFPAASSRYLFVVFH